MLKNRWATRVIDMVPVALFAIIVLLAMQSPDLQTPARVMVVNAVMVVGSYIFIGNSGILSFGHIGFAAVGAYVSALATMSPRIKSGLLDGAPAWLVAIEINPALGILLGGLGAALVGWVVSLSIMRLSGLSAGIATLAMLVMIQVVVGNADPITGGKNSLIGIPGGTDVYVPLLWLIAICVLAYVFQHTRTGRRLRASREDEVAARSIGIKVTHERRVSFVLSAFAVGIGGALYGQVLGSINADAFYFTLTFAVLLMLVFGGMNSLFGALVGTLVITVLGEVLRRWERGVELFGFMFTGQAGIREIVLGIAMLVVLFLFREGLTRGREFSGLFKKRPQAIRTTVIPTAGSKEKREPVQEEKEAVRS
ncbi:branched-chain amino acid ABC transporter permease [Ruicaihuangia caeni]|uniref:Branched-chain amino acid ABC transporter permease n=1 Tax=Ruicaihuangia caeni TaxID=3042517 RepID=A0AAW6TB77_9MICO|nr:branched-chain amino acid ABC transporter permease [Klugiella sp. YN-L-19]MDI2099093.1 branched-chain amino acid ABC transporter permease [Klugiella sp. YN-L-19]